MRSRKEIETQARMNHVPGSTAQENTKNAVKKMFTELSLEVLLDIRELLVDQNNLLEDIKKSQ